MGLKITTFKKNGQTFTSAYAKVSNIRYDNDSKIASFGIKIFSNKDDNNLITELQNQWVKIVNGTDMVAQCYGKINTMISQLNTQIDNLQLQINASTDNDNNRLRFEHQLSQIKLNDILQFAGSTEW